MPRKVTHSLERKVSPDRKYQSVLIRGVWFLWSFGSYLEADSAFERGGLIIPTGLQGKKAK